MMNLKISKWKDNKKAPVVFVIDDLANIYIKKSKSNKLQVGEDWGHCGLDKNSMWSFLNKNLLNKFPDIKTTLLLVTKKRAPMRLNEEYTLNHTMNEDKKFINFLKYLNNHPNIEIAYHGTTHGKAQEEAKNFIQEWETYKSLDDAKKTINEGRELFKSVLNEYPMGGKYCGYKEGKFGKDSIAQTNFKWWCYHEDNLIWDKNSTDKRYQYDLEFIQGVVNIPTTVDASNLSLKIVNKLFTRKYLKSLYLYITSKKTVEKHIQSLYSNQEVISIYEHTSPYMTNNTIQYPNIVTDIENLNLIFSILSTKDIWYATCNELADYFIAREKCKLEIDKEYFKIKSDLLKDAELTITIPYEGVKVSLFDENNKFLKQFVINKDILHVTYNFKIDKRYYICQRVIYK
jgi:hypothetical protein